AVNPGVANTIRIGVADVGDAKYDSNLLIAANSIQSNLVAMDDHVEIVTGHSKVVDLLGNDVNAIGGTMTVTHINGVAVVPGQSVTLANGQVVTLNPDLTVTIL